jgi:sporulation protein YlmC with PRC-barrel domain
MILRFGAPCRSRGERLGTLWGVSVEPSEKLLLRVIVEEPQAEPLVRVRVPFNRVEQADADQVVLGVSAAEMKSFPPMEADARGSNARRRASRRRRGDEPAERVLSARARIVSREGNEVGSLSALSVDARTGDLEDLSFPFGMPLTREVVIPAQHVDELREDRIALKVGVEELAHFSSRHT